jgi:uroporphyrinogen decarboxylase
MNRFQQTLAGQNSGPPPVWFMRQAGRYHQHYQALRQHYSFLEVCRLPEVSAEAAMGPMEDFDFDAAILFSDILFPLAAMGVPLDFNPGPQLGFLLQEKKDLQRYQTPNQPESFFQFQADAISRLRQRLPANKGMIGFVGGPFTLYAFAVAGSGKQDDPAITAGLTDGRFAGFMERLAPVLLANMAAQAKAGPDCLAVLDSSAGRLAPGDYIRHYLPILTDILQDFNSNYPALPILYYGKGIGPEIWRHLTNLPITALGIDHGQDMAAALDEFGSRFTLQGNIPPEWMNLPEAECRQNLQAYFTPLAALPARLRQGWICGLGHGILPTAREANVHHTIALAREMLA